MEQLFTNTKTFIAAETLFLMAFDAYHWVDGIVSETTEYLQKTVEMFARYSGKPTSPIHIGNLFPKQNRAYPPVDWMKGKSLHTTASTEYKHINI